MVVLPLFVGGPGSGQQRQRQHNMAVTVGLDGTVRRWSLHPGEMEDERGKAGRGGDEGVGDEAQGEGTLMTEEEERELAELMD